MSGSGTSRARRRARRLAVRRSAEKAALLAAAPAEVTDNTFADGDMEPNTGKCADGNCGHPAGMHGGEMNAGSCKANGCSCDAFDDGKTSSKASIGEAFVKITPNTEGFVEKVEAVVAEALERADALAAAATAAKNGDTVTVSFELSDFRPVGEISADDLAGLGEFVYEVRDALLADSQVSGDPMLPPEHQPQDRKPRTKRGPAAPSATVVPGGLLAWQATIAPEGKLTDDGRAFAPDSIKWRDLPLSLGAMLDTPHADTVTKSEVCGRIDNIWRDGSELRATGVFDSGEYGRKIAAMVEDKTLRGVSVDLAVNSFEVGPKADFFDEDGNWAPKEAEEGDEDKGGGLLDLLFGGEDSIFVVTDGTIGAVTVCPFPAFAGATIDVADSLTAGGAPAVWTITSQAGFTVVASKDASGASALTASAVGLAPLAPPADWFAPPNLDELTPLTVDDEGRLFGHAASWDVCHIGIPGTCTTAPHTATNYAYYHLKEVVCDDGSRVACGTVTMSAHHANRNLGRADAAAHYDHTGTAVADVVVGEDEHGIWVAGALRGDVSEEQARALRGAALSGDWRDVHGNLELVALLAVNVPGFPIPRGPSAALVASGEGMLALSLLSAGVVTEAREPTNALSKTEKAQFEAIGAANDYAALRELARAAA